MPHGDDGKRLFSCVLVFGGDLMWDGKGIDGVQEGRE